MKVRLELYKKNLIIYRVIDVMATGEVLLIDCRKQNMPVWHDADYLAEGQLISEDEFLRDMQTEFENLDSVELSRQRAMRERYTFICCILPHIGDIEQRAISIASSAETYGVSKRTVRNYLCKYLAFNDMRALLPVKRNKEIHLSQDEKNMRWGLNKFFYNGQKLSLHNSYLMLLKAKYCDSNGKLLAEYPSFYQYRYFYRKTRKLQNYYISRDGIKKYQKDNRPLLGDGVQGFAPGVGTGMVDATICDIYLVNEEGRLVGRPILTACVDAYSGLCWGYTLSWEGGVYSLRGLMLNVIEDKVKRCKEFGIEITEEQWPAHCLPGKIVSDRGTEYVGDTFAQIAELGVTLVNLPPYRPELKGPVEKFFDLIQGEYKPLLKGKGVVEPDYQERGSHDYRKDACLTMRQFEQVVLRCIVHYNSSDIIEDFPFDEDMLDAGVKPYSSTIWEWGINLANKNVIDVSREKLVNVLLPRTDGKFSKHGLSVNKLRYKRDGYTEAYLRGDKVTVAYNPDDVSYVWLIEDGDYVKFELIETRFMGDSLEQVDIKQKKKKAIIKAEQDKEIQAKLDLMTDIAVIADGANNNGNVKTKNIRANRQKERDKTHIDFTRGDANAKR